MNDSTDSLIFDSIVDALMFCKYGCRKIISVTEWWNTLGYEGFYEVTYE